MMQIIDCHGNPVVNGDIVQSHSGKKYTAMFTDGGIVLEQSSTWLYNPSKGTGSKQYVSSSYHPITISFENFPNTQWHKV
jgi:hypothetical protein